jgi:orotate phosphoribosyltransferase
MSAGTAVRESIALIQAAGATPHAVAIALDRQEKATENGVDVNHSAVQYVTQQLGLQVCAIARLGDLLDYLAAQSGAGAQAGGAQLLQDHYQAVLAYRTRYGVD